MPFNFALHILFSIYCVINTIFSIYYVILTLTITISCNIIQKCNGAWLFASCMIAAATAYINIDDPFCSITFSFSPKSLLFFQGSFFFRIYGTSSFLFLVNVLSFYLPLKGSKRLWWIYFDSPNYLSDTLSNNVYLAKFKWAKNTIVIRTLPEFISNLLFTKQKQ